MKQLENTIHQLKTDPLYAIAVYNRDTLKSIVINVTGAEMVEDFGSVEGFFENLKTRGFKSIKIYNRRKNGNVYRAVDDYNFDILSKENPTEAQSKATVHEAVPMPQNNSWLTGGLNMMDVAFKTQDHARVTTENDRLRLENEALKNQIFDLKETIMQNKYSSDKSNANADLFKTLAPLLAPIVGKMAAGGGDATGMAAPAEILSQIKTVFIQAIKRADDSLIHDLYEVSQAMMDVEFDTKLTALLDEYKAKKEADAA